jgi:hypothetical protein
MRRPGLHALLCDPVNLDELKHRGSSTLVYLRNIQMKQPRTNLLRKPDENAKDETMPQTGGKSENTIEFKGKERGCALTFIPSFAWIQTLRIDSEMYHVAKQLFAVQFVSVRTSHAFQNGDFGLLDAAGKQ